MTGSKPRKSPPRKGGRTPSATIAERTFLDVRTGEPIRLAIYPPEPNPDYDDEWGCRVEIRWKAKIKSLTGRGVDSLQSLLSALDGLRLEMKQHAAEVSYLGVRGWLGMPIMIGDDNPDFLALVEHLVGVEHCRRAILLKDIHRRKK